MKNPGRGRGYVFTVSRTHRLTPLPTHAGLGMKSGVESPGRSSARAGGFTRVRGQSRSRTGPRRPRPRMGAMSGQEPCAGGGSGHAARAASKSLIKGPKSP